MIELRGNDVTNELIVPFLRVIVREDLVGIVDGLECLLSLFLVSLALVLLNVQVWMVLLGLVEVGLADLFLVRGSTYLQHFVEVDG